MRFPSLTLILTGALLALHLLFNAGSNTLIWLPETTELWRWLSAHFVHISGTHLLWNALAFLILGSIIEQRSKAHLVYALVAGMLSVNLYLATIYTLSAYAGLSGVLNSLLVVALFQLCRSDAYRTAAMLSLIGSMIKIIVEMNTGVSLVSQLAWPPVPLAHLAGWLGGVTLCIIISCSHRKQDRLLLLV